MLKAEVSSQKYKDEESLNLFEAAHEVLIQYQNDKCRKIIEFIETDLYAYILILRSLKCFIQRKMYSKKSNKALGDKKRKTGCIPLENVLVSNLINQGFSKYL